MLCSRCNREIKNFSSDAEEVICDKCVNCVVDEIDRLKLVPFSVNGLYWALRSGNLGKWMKTNGLNPFSLEEWTGISKTLWYDWKAKKTTDIKIADIRASIYATLRDGFSKTRV